MSKTLSHSLVCFVLAFTASAQQIPHAISGGYELPNGWRLTPLGRAVATEDMVLNVSMAPDHKAVVALHSGFNPHGLVVVDARSEEAVQRIPLKSAWLGLAWHPNGKRLYVSGGNANGKKPTRAPIYIFDYENGRLSKEPAGTLEETIDTSELYWSGLVHHQSKPLLFAANRGTGAEQRGGFRNHFAQTGPADSRGSESVCAGAQRQRPDALRVQLGKRFGQHHRREHAARYGTNRGGR
jgi:hypothetical protein